MYMTFVAIKKKNTIMDFAIQYNVSLIYLSTVNKKISIYVNKYFTCVYDCDFRDIKFEILSFARLIFYMIF